MGRSALSIPQSRRHLSCEQCKLIRETGKAGDAPPRPAFNKVGIDQANGNVVVALSLGALAGKPAFIDVWASWCVPCREEAPMLARLWRAYRSEVQFLGIDVEDTRGDARAFVRRYGLGYPNIFDRQAALAGKLGFFGLPTAYLIDTQGRIAAKLVGKQREATFRSGLAALTREAKSSR